MERIVHNGRETVYRHTGSEAAGPTVLYVHGSGGTHRLWTQQYSPDGPLHPAVALDLSGHGDSTDVDVEAGPEALAAYAEDVRAVANETNAEVLVGNSLGGAVVIEVVRSGMYDPAGLVLVGSGAKLGVHETIRSLLANDFDALIDSLHDDSRLFYNPDERVLERSKETMRQTGRCITQRDFLTCHAFDARADLSTIDIPAMAICGEHDSLTPPAYHEYLATELPRGEFVTIERAAHLVMLERPRAFGGALEAFARELALD